MKLSSNWLLEWVPNSQNVQELAEKLTLAGLEIDAIAPVAGSFENVIVAEVVQTRPHPQADKLSICAINTGKGELLQVVCGAANVRAGLKVALAQIGTVMPNGLKIKEAKLRGELSQGMLCSATELGLSDISEGIIELDENAPAGKDLRQYLSLDDHILDVDLTPNRADCLSVRGLAREISALYGIPLNTFESETAVVGTDEEKQVLIETPEACPRYCGRIISNINSLASTPLWLKERLRRSGLRSIHPVVDVTNYVMLELGQPLHAFDCAQIAGGIIVRMGNNESISLLDGQKITADNKTLLICDEEKPLALAGIMGGSVAAVQEQTQTIFLESAYFSPKALAGVARRYGLCTDSSQRFERGVDYELPRIAIERATNLILDICGGHPGPISENIHTSFIPAKKIILFSPEKVQRLTGVFVPVADMEAMLQNLGMDVVRQGQEWLVTPPSHRFDINLDVDLVEEIIRLNGYAQIPETRLAGIVQGGIVAPEEALTTVINRFFMHRGYNETITYSFVDPHLQEMIYPQEKTLSLLNPISSELSQMRVGMWPGLLASMIYNAHRQQDSFKLFESGVVFLQANGQLEEQAAVAGLLSGRSGELNWSEAEQVYDFFDVKGDLQALFHQLNIKDVKFVRNAHSALHPGKSAQIIIEGQPAGWCGCLHPGLADALDIDGEVYLFELAVAALIRTTTIRYAPISKFPQIRRDLSMLVAEDLPAERIELLVREVVPATLLKSFHIFDVYCGKNIPQGKKSLAIALILQDQSKTLVELEINQVIDAILKKLEGDLSITLRD